MRDALTWLIAFAAAIGAGCGGSAPDGTAPAARRPAVDLVIMGGDTDFFASNDRATMAEFCRATGANDATAAAALVDADRVYTLPRSDGISVEDATLEKAHVVSDSMTLWTARGKTRRGAVWVGVWVTVDPAK